MTLHAKQKIPGIIGIKPPHLMKDEESKKMQESEAMFIDIGAKDKKEVEAKGIRPGTPITFDTEFAEFSPDLVVGKAFDDRCGCAILLRLAEEFAHGVPKDVTLYLVGTVREETGLWGAGASAFAIEPDLAIAVDVGIAGGTPDVSEDVVPVKLGEGPGLGVMEGGGRGLIMPKRLVAWIEALAKKHKIKLQFEVLDRGSTDASRMQYSRAGFLAASISVPSRYIHSQNELLSLKDLEHTKELLKAIIHEFPHYR